MRKTLRQRIKRIATLIAIILVLFCVLFKSTITVWAEISTFDVLTSNQDDVYNHLKEAAMMHHLGQIFRYCMRSSWDEENVKIVNFHIDTIADGTFFLDPGGEINGKSVALWLEHAIERNSGDDGQFQCNVSAQPETSIVWEFLKYLHAAPDTQEYPNVICGSDGNSGILRRWIDTQSAWSGSPTDFMNYSSEESKGNFDDANCKLFDENIVPCDRPGYEDKYCWVGYVGNPNWEEKIEELWEEKRKENPYIIPWNKISEGYDNVDGYFNYVIDFGFSQCKQKSNHFDTDPSGQNIAAKGISIFTKQLGEDDPKIIAKRHWYYVKDNASYKWREMAAGEAPPASNDTDMATCNDLLDSIDRLDREYNGIASDLQKGHEQGFRFILLNELNTACDNEHRFYVDPSTGERTNQDIYSVVYPKYEEVLNDPEADPNSNDYKKALASKEKIDNARQSGQWFEEQGEETDANGKQYLCIQLENVDDTETPYEPEILEEAEPPAETYSDQDNCYKNAGSLGWIICPVVDAARNAIINTYGAVVEPSLQMDVTLFHAGNAATDGAYKAWNIFRVFANMLFVILFVFIIFSQVTGIGIDNYGIKKAVPKLFAAAIMINLSFVICQTSVDLCNIAGRSVGKLFQSITEQVKYPTYLAVTVGDTTTNVRSTDKGSWKDTDTWGSSFNSNFLGNSAIVILVAALGVGIVLSQGLAILVPVFVMMIGIIIAILGLVVILGIRQAAAVLLVVVSPIALVCYILPNTKKLYQKWLHAFIGLLTAYPICSALVYGGDMAATILLKVANENPEGNMWILISAAAVSVAPIFIIPGVIKKSVGAISGGIATLSTRGGNFLKGKAQKRMDNSFLTNRKKYNENLRNQKHAASASAYNAKRGKRIMNGHLGRKLASGKNLSARQQRTYNVAMGAVNSENADQVESYTSSFQGKTDEEIADALVRNAGSGTVKDPNMLVAGLSSIRDEATLTNTMRRLGATGALDRMNATDNGNYKRVAGVLQGRKGSVINQSMGKLMNQNENVGAMWQGGADSKLAKKVRSAGTDVMASQQASVFATGGAADLFSVEQHAAAFDAGLSGQKLANVAEMLEGSSDEFRSDIAAHMTVNGLGTLNTADTTTSFGQSYGGSLGVLGGGSAEAGAELVKNAAKGTVAQLNGADGRDARAGMESRAAELLGVDGEADMLSTGVSSSGSISSGIDANNMTESEAGYMRWQMIKNPAGGTADDSGEIDIAHPTAPDLHSVNETGTKRDKDGNIVGQRAEEGNQFDYNPRQSGETSADYGARLKWQKEVAAWAETLAPRGDNETIEKYRERTRPPSLEEWQASGGGKITGPHKPKP